MNKQYFYDYKAALPTSTSGEIRVEPAADQPAPEKPVTTPPAKPQPIPPVQARYQAPVQKSNFIPTVAVIVFLLIAGTIIYSRLPKTFDQCAKWPFSKLDNSLPSTCKTFYGKAFTQSGTGFDFGQSDTDTSPLSYGDLGRVSGDTDTNLPDADQPTTKGGLPLTTPTPVPTSKPLPPEASAKGGPTKPANPDTSQSDTANWTTHRYPTQKISLKLPDTWNSTRVTRNVATDIMTFQITSNGTVIDAKIQPNWDNTGTAKNNSITFMLPNNTGVIKEAGDKIVTYYFEYSARVYIFTGYHNGNAGLQNLIDQVLKSIQFI